MWKFKQKEGHKLLRKFGAVFSPYNNCLQVSRAKSDFKPKPWCTIWLYYISKLYWIISNDSSYCNKNFLVLPHFKTKASVKIIGGLAPSLHPPPSVCHCSITNQNLKLENFWKLIVSCLYILSCVPPSWNLSYIFCFSIFFNSVYLCSKHSLYFWCTGTYVGCIVYLYFMWLIMVLIKSTLLV